MTEEDQSHSMTFPILKTKRLLLREVVPADAGSILSFKGDPVVQKYDDPPLKDLGEAVDFIERTRADFASGRTIPWAVTFRDSEIVIGMAGYHDWNKWHCRAEIGYGFARAYWGRGIASEAIDAILGFGFDRMKLNRIEAYTISDNTGSVRLLERLGFRREGTRRMRSLEDDGLFHDSAVYGLLRQEYGPPVG